MLTTFEQWQGLALALAVISPLAGWLGWLWRPRRTTDLRHEGE